MHVSARALSNYAACYAGMACSMLRPALTYALNTSCDIVLVILLQDPDSRANVLIMLEAVFEASFSHKTALQARTPAACLPIIKMQMVCTAMHYLHHGGASALLLL